MKQTDVSTENTQKKCLLHYHTVFSRYVKQFFLNAFNFFVYIQWKKRAVSPFEAEIVVQAFQPAVPRFAKRFLFALLFLRPLAEMKAAPERPAVPGFAPAVFLERAPEAGCDEGGEFRIAVRLRRDAGRGQKIPPLQIAGVQHMIRNVKPATRSAPGTCRAEPLLFGFEIGIQPRQFGKRLGMHMHMILSRLRESATELFSGLFSQISFKASRKHPLILKYTN
jgi:hypothetical protein